MQHNFVFQLTFYPFHDKINKLPSTIFKFQINTCNKPGQLSVDEWLKINTCNKPRNLSFFLLGQRLIPKTRQDNYLNDR